MLGALLFTLVASSIGAKPAFRTPFVNVTIEVDKFVYLVCEAEGERPITYKWYNQDEDEITADNMQPVHVAGWGNDSSLFFKNVSYEQEGLYTCIASNAHGLASKVFDLEVSSPNGTEPEFRTPVENFTLAEGSYVQLLCKADGEKPMTYKWYYNQDYYEEMPEDSNQTVFVRQWNSDSSLVFKNLSSDHEGSYACTASNANGVTSKVFFLSVTSTNRTKPEFRTFLENFTLAEGRYVHLLCKAEGEKPMTYKWYNQDYDEMTEDSNQTVYVRQWDSDSSLVFKNLSSEHEGSYTCIASNTHGMASKVFFLNVTSPNGSNDTDIDQGNGTSGFRDVKVLKLTARSVTFYITTSGPVQYIEAKYREGARASNTTTIRLNTDSGNNSFEISNLLPSGFYSFQFRTMPSKSNKWSRQFNVTLLPDSPEIILESTCNQSVRLLWFRREDDILRGTIDKHQIKHYSVEMLGDNIWTSGNCSVTTEVPTCVGSSYTIWGLNRTIFYQIEVRAHTEAGYGEPWMQKVYLP